jgi:hypothetical protein
MLALIPYGRVSRRLNGALSSQFERRSAFLVLMQVFLWTALVKVGLVTGAVLAAASRYLLNGLPA